MGSNNSSFRKLFWTPAPLPLPPSGSPDPGLAVIPDFCLALCYLRAVVRNVLHTLLHPVFPGKGKITIGHTLNEPPFLQWKWGLVHLFPIFTHLLSSVVCEPVEMSVEMTVLPILFHIKLFISKKPL
jgi:hypothetical protein